MLPASVRRLLSDAAAPIQARARGVSWVSSDNYHLTLKFLGDIDEGQVPEIGSALSAAAAVIPEFDVALGGLGAFPGSSRPRVIWAGVTDGGPPLAELAGAVDAGLASLGFPPETRVFSAHVTLGRVREPRRDPELAELLAQADRVELGGTRVDRIVLMRSQLSPRGARYSELVSAPLAAEIARET